MVEPFYPFGVSSITSIEGTLGVKTISLTNYIYLLRSYQVISPFIKVIE